jgi:probable F420-dependent oxidoreductase
MPSAPTRAEWADKVRRAEAAGFYSVSVPDHLGRNLPQLAPLVALASAAAVTSEVRLAITVLDNDFRHPVMLAKEIATLDVLSDGRVDLGMGAGWMPDDYQRTGVATWDPPGVRVSRLVESVGVVRRLLAGETVTHHGEHYDLDGFESFPLPVQARVPLLVGAAGKRLLSFAAREADIVSTIVGLGPGVQADRRLESFREQLAWIEAARGERDLTVGIRVLFGEVTAGGSAARQEAAGRIAAAGGMSVDEALASPFGLLGDIGAVEEHVLMVRERYGVSYFTVSEDLAWAIAPVVARLHGG